MKYLTAASCLLVVLLGALVAPSMSTALSTSGLQRRLIRLLETRANKKKNGKKNGKKGGKKDDDEGGVSQQEDGGTGSQGMDSMGMDSMGMDSMGRDSKGPHEMDMHDPFMIFELCEAGEIDNQDVCDLVDRMTVVGEEKEPCSFLAMEDEAGPSDEQVGACVDSINSAIDAASAADPFTMEYYIAADAALWQLHELARALKLYGDMEDDGTAIEPFRRRLF